MARIWKKKGESRANATGEEWIEQSGVSSIGGITIGGLHKSEREGRARAKEQHEAEAPKVSAALKGLCFDSISSQNSFDTLRVV